MIEWAGVVQDHGPQVWRVITRLVRNHADAADCFQATFLSALEWSKRETVRSWPAVLTHLATARSLECLRRSARYGRRVSALEVESSDLAEDTRGVGPADRLLVEELSEQLRRALVTLDPREAEVFCLVCLENLSYQQVADRLGVTPNHVGVILHRAKAGLRQELEAFDPRPRGQAEVRP
jgi:RNA polymerase sigma-70 factor (ECF subfamily)